MIIYPYHFRVYDNAKANAVMQQAIKILNIEEGLSKNQKEAFRCKDIDESYDGDLTEDGKSDLKKVTF